MVPGRTVLPSDPDQGGVARSVDRGWRREHLCVRGALAVEDRSTRSVESADPVAPGRATSRDSGHSDRCSRRSSAVLRRQRGRRRQRSIQGLRSRRRAVPEVPDTHQAHHTGGPVHLLLPEVSDVTTTTSNPATSFLQQPATSTSNQQPAPATSNQLPPAPAPAPAPATSTSPSTQYQY
jgi:hypothetical protein